jgi:transcriptional regulator with XRE-family HTH domain
MLEAPSPSDQTHRHELARFLRDRREALSPVTAPGRDNSRRRAKGWLREEVAQAAGISATWVMWLEQGREVRASARTLGGLARALRLNATERAYLFRLARPDLAPPVLERMQDPSAQLIGFIKGLSPHPAYAKTHIGDIVAQNAEAEYLFGPVDAEDPLSRNVIARLFLEQRQLFENWEVIARAAVGQLRAASAGFQDDPALKLLPARLGQESADFRDMWGRGELSEPPNWRKVIRHPTGGRLVYDYTSLAPLGADSGYRVTVYIRAGGESAAK